MRPNAPSFVHALDTAGRTARCIDLPADLGTGDPTAAKLTLDGGTLTVVDGEHGPVARVDTRTFAVRRAGTEEPAARGASTRAAKERPVASGDSGGAWPWLLAAIPLLGVAATLAVQRRRRREPVQQ
jgi:hypothetical protein